MLRRRLVLSLLCATALLTTAACTADGDSAGGEGGDTSISRRDTGGGGSDRDTTTSLPDVTVNTDTGTGSPDTGTGTPDTGTGTPDTGTGTPDTGGPSACSAEGNDPLCVEDIAQCPAGRQCFTPATCEAGGNLCVTPEGGQSLCLPKCDTTTNQCAGDARICTPVNGAGANAGVCTRSPYACVKSCGDLTRIANAGATCSNATTCGLPNGFCGGAAGASSSSCLQICIPGVCDTTCTGGERCNAVRFQDGSQLENEDGGVLGVCVAPQAGTAGNFAGCGGTSSDACNAQNECVDIQGANRPTGTCLPKCGDGAPACPQLGGFASQCAQTPLGPLCVISCGEGDTCPTGLSCINAGNKICAR